MSKNIEIEVRGPLNTDEYNSLKDFLDENAEFIRKQHRVFVDYSTFLDGGIRDRKLDIRARIINGIPEIIIKIGKFGGSESREEISAKLQPGEFSNLIKAYAALGYKKGVLCERKTLTYIYNDVEFTLVEVPEHSYFYEAEVLANKNEDLIDIKNKIENECQKLNLSLFNDESFFNYIEKLNVEANGVYDFEKDGWDFFKNKYGF